MATPAMSTPSGASTSKVCSTCRGTGVIGKAPNAQACPVCQGAGVVQQQPIRVPFDLVLPNAVLTANQTGLPVNVQIPQDADFEAIWIVANSTGLYSVQLQDPSTGRFLSNSAVNGENFAGTAQLPFPLIEPYVWARSALVNAIFNDRSGSGNTVQLVIRGYRLYPRSNPAQGSQGQIVQA